MDDDLSGIWLKWDFELFSNVQIDDLSGRRLKWDFVLFVFEISHCFVTFRYQTMKNILKIELTVVQKNIQCFLAASRPQKPQMTRFDRSIFSFKNIAFDDLSGRRLKWDFRGLSARNDLSGIPLKSSSTVQRIWKLAFWRSLYMVRWCRCFCISIIWGQIWDFFVKLL